MKRKEAIKKLRQGSIQIENDLLPSIKEIKKLLKKAFPDDVYLNTKYTGFLNKKYFYKSENSNLSDLWFSTKYPFNNIQIINLSSITKPKNKLKQLEKGYSELCKDVSELKSLVSAPAEVKLEPHFENVKSEDISGWYKDEKYPKWIMYIDYENKRYYGFDANGDWHTAKENYVMKPRIGEILCSPQEVEKALIAEANKRGFKEGIDCFWEDNNITHKNLNGEYSFESEFNALFIGNKAIFEKGNWAGIIQETPIKEEEINWSEPQKLISINTNTIVQTTGKNIDENFEGIVLMKNDFYEENEMKNLHKPSFKKFKGTLTINKE